MFKLKITIEIINQKNESVDINGNSSHVSKRHQLQNNFVFMECATVKKANSAMNALYSTIKSIKEMSNV